MKTILLLSLAGMLFSVGCATTGGGGSASGKDLNGAKGSVFHVDVSNGQFRFLTETTYDPKTQEGTSWYTVELADDVKITRIREQRSFAGIKGPCITDFHGIRETDAKALKEGKPFVARVAIVMLHEKVAAGVDENYRKIVSWFTPDKGDAPMSGTIDANGKPVKVTMRKRHWRIFVHERITPDELSKGFWQAELQGKEERGKFVVSSMTVHPRLDPRTVDDPKLPRIIVIGDSISMNYHEAAKEALKGTANYYRCDANCWSVFHGVNNARHWLGDYESEGLHWDVVQFNHGLHDMKQKVLGGPFAVSIDDYKKNLRKIIPILKKTGATLVWCSTTPVPNDLGSAHYAFRTKGSEKVFNEAALEVMREYPEIHINDLCKAIDASRALDNWRKGKDVHFWNKNDQAVVGKAVADALRKVLKSKGK